MINKNFLNSRQDKNFTLERLLKSKFFLNSRLSNDFHIKWNNSKEKFFWYWIIKQYNFFLNKKNRKQIVPKKIHQIWIGSKIPKKYEQWSKNWKKLNPDYEYFLWDEEKILKLGLVNYKQFLKTKNNGVKSDIARYEILNRFGGIYADLDFEPIKKIGSKYLNHSFIAGQMFDSKPCVANGLIISSKGSQLSKLLINNLGDYPNRLSIADEIMHYSGPYYLTKIIKKNKKKLKDIVILPSQYFYPWPNFLAHNKENPHSYITNKSMVIHHWHVSWLRETFMKRILNKIKKMIL
jgi:hypothetical protein